jgi:hypothetical protein
MMSGGLGAMTSVTDIPVLGVPVRFESNSPEAIDLVEQSFRVWRILASRPELQAAARLTVRIAVSASEAADAAGPDITHYMPDRQRLLLALPGGVACADFGRREAVAHVAEGLLAQREFIRRNVIEGLTLFMITQLDRHPVHAAAVARGGVALLLAGPSGVGKSTLAYAAVREGLTFLSDDTVYVQQDPRLRIWGMPARFCLTPDARTHFPELADAEPTALGSGKTKIVVDTIQCRDEEPLPMTERAAVVLLTMDGSRFKQRVDPATAVTALTCDTEPGFDLYAPTLSTVVRKLARDGAWRIRIDQSPRQLVETLYEIFDVLEC